MKPNFYSIFRDRLLEAEEEPSTSEEPKKEKEDKSKVKIDNESTLDKVLKKSKKIPSVLAKLMTTQNTYNKKAEKEIREVVADIRCISYKPTTFRIVIPNGNYFDIKYDPTPMQIKYEDDFDASDAFTVNILGKRYGLSNKSDYEQCIDYVNTLLQNKPIAKVAEPEEEPTAPEAGGEEPIPEEPKAPEEEAPKK